MLGVVSARVWGMQIWDPPFGPGQRPRPLVPYAFSSDTASSFHRERHRVAGAIREGFGDLAHLDRLQLTPNRHPAPKETNTQEEV
jgi:hypothetical protein